jgi:hypothetical protein
MRKRIINHDPQTVSPVDQSWIDLQYTAKVELTSEDAAHPIEEALTNSLDSMGWRAAQAGEQTIRLLFDEPRRVRRIQLQFHEDQQARTQEFVLQWSPDGQSYREIVRQQYNFSPPGMTREFEDYTVDLVGVKVLELRILPDISGGDARASVAQLRIA